MAGSKKNDHFFPLEDEYICHAWKQTERESDEETEAHFWSRVHERWVEMEVYARRRSTKVIRARFEEIKPYIICFDDIILYIGRHYKNLDTLDARLKEAHRVFKNSHGIVFEWEDCWFVLRNVISTLRDDSIRTRAASTSLQNENVDEFLGLDLISSLGDDSATFIAQSVDDDVELDLTTTQKQEASTSQVESRTTQVEWSTSGAESNRFQVENVDEVVHLDDF